MTTTDYPAIDVHDAVWGDDEHLWGPDVRALGLDDEMEDVELGWRASLWMTNNEMARIYSSEDDRSRATAFVLVAAIASATSHRGLPLPPEWWPPSAGPYQDVRADNESES